ncbi:MAG TPA: GDSL-type esterase/lipase family protein [Ktedonosporobacter sp.]|nr:GDSL-type esterase/lipase family protein [Ktedonosporobacter sp.]
MHLLFKKHILYSVLLLIFIQLTLYSNIGLERRVYAATSPGAVNDANIKYVGRWDTGSSTVVKSYWGGAYFKTGFTGTTVKIQLAAPVTIWVSIDGTDTRYENVSGLVDLTPTPLVARKHFLRVAAQSEKDSIQFQGLVLDAGASTFAPPLSSKLIEFVGDSITAGWLDTRRALSDYAWIVGERLSMEHTQIAQPGICLIDGVQCYSNYPIGMSQQFFKTQTVDTPNSSNWDFSRYQPEAVVINLGTNEHWTGQSDVLFEKTYINFLQRMRTTYPNALIFVLRTFGGHKVDQTMSAVQSLIATEEENVSYIDSTDWLSKDDYVSDGVHPNDEGQVKIADALEPILAEALNVFPADPTTSYKVTNRLSGMSLSLANAGNAIVQRKYLGTDDQRWNLLPVGDGSYKLMNVKNKLLLQYPHDASIAGSERSALLETGADDGEMSQWFELREGENGSYNLVNEGNGLYADDARTLHASGDPISGQSPDGKRDQEWRIIPVI